MSSGIEKSSSFSQDFKLLRNGDTKFAAYLLSTISTSSFLPSLPFLHSFYLSLTLSFTPSFSFSFSLSHPSDVFLYFSIVNTSTRFQSFSPFLSLSLQPFVFLSVSHFNWLRQERSYFAIFTTSGNYSNSTVTLNLFYKTLGRLSLASHYFAIFSFTNPYSFICSRSNSSCLWVVKIKTHSTIFFFCSNLAVSIFNTTCNFPVFSASTRNLFFFSFQRLSFQKFCFSPTPLSPPTWLERFAQVAAQNVAQNVGVMLPKAYCWQKIFAKNLCFLKPLYRRPSACVRQRWVLYYKMQECHNYHTNFWTATRKYHASVLGSTAYYQVYGTNH